VNSEVTADVAAVSEKVLRQNWREGSLADGTAFAYTRPSLTHYRWQWYWDSCFAAIAWHHFDRSRSERELRTLLNGARPDGFIGHTIFWDQPLTGLRRFTYNITEANAPMTSSIQPPALAWAWSLTVGDPAVEPGITQHHQWLQENRDLDGDGLIWIVQPDESGLDASPQFDPIWRERAHSRPGFIALVRRNRHLSYDARAIAAAGGPVCCEVATNVLYSLSRTALGLPSLTRVLIDRCYDEGTGLFFPLSRPAGHDNARRPVTWAALAPLALPDLPDEIGHRLVREHLLDPTRFWLPAGPPSVDASDPTFLRGDSSPPLHWPRRYWRGPMWINSAWLLWRGLVRLGYAQEARGLADRVITTVASQGLREYYDPYSGTGAGQHGFSWSALVMELLETPHKLKV
jgi:hypothetical protein